MCWRCRGLALESLGVARRRSDDCSLFLYLRVKMRAPLAASCTSAACILSPWSVCGQGVCKSLGRACANGTTGLSPPHPCLSLLWARVRGDVGLLGHVFHKLCIAAWRGNVASHSLRLGLDRRRACAASTAAAPERPSQGGALVPEPQLLASPSTLSTPTATCRGGLAPSLMFSSLLCPRGPRARARKESALVAAAAEPPPLHQSPSAAAQQQMLPAPQVRGDAWLAAPARGLAYPLARP